MNTSKFLTLVMLYSMSLWLTLLNRKFPKLKTVSNKFVDWVKSLDNNDGSGVSKLYLIEIAFKNMVAKKTRTTITIGGMAIGISFIVFLVSVGYGLQELVVARVARLDELQQAEVIPGLSRDLSLNDETIAKFKNIANVSSVLPLIAVVGRVSYENSVSDIAVYGATADYLKFSALKPIKGAFFESNSLSLETATLGSVAGTTTASGSIGEELEKVSYSLNADTWLKVRAEPTTNAPILGYTKRVEGYTSGREVWGGSYTSENSAGHGGTDDDGKDLGKWIKAPFLLWKKQNCEVETTGDCEAGLYLVLRDQDNFQVQKEGYIAEIGLTVNYDHDSTRVLGVSSDNHDGLLPVVELASESATGQSQNVTKVEVVSGEKKQVVVNRSVLQLLNIPENESLGKQIILSMVVVGELLDDPNQRLESTPVTYSIVGVIPDEGTPIVYVPFIDVRSLGVNRFSQTKVIVKNKTDLAKVRSTIESAGYGTVSVADTVAQIDNLFVNFRLVLSILGMVALSVAALGMFNTLTVSLLERTREVGLMKAMGMKSDEVKSLFLTESMIMGLYGGILGLLLGVVAGKVLSLILSALSIIKKVGFVDIAYVPPIFVLAVLLLSVLVGIATGYFPAKRATKISALNALRYE